MRILLIGEYSNVHHTLAEAFRRRGHEVWLVSDGDGWKDYPRDADISRTQAGWRGSLSLIQKVWKLLPQMKGWDVVQLINPAVLYLKPKWNRWFFDYLKRNNRRVSLGCYGDDSAVVEGMKNDRWFDYTDFWADGGALDFPQNRERFALWQSADRRALCEHVSAQADDLMACLYEYYKVYDQVEYNARLHYVGLPIDLSSSSFTTKGVGEKIKILVGIQKSRAQAKGTDKMLPLLERLAAEHPEAIEVRKAENVPFAQYQQMLREADVLVDQLYSYTPAMNALTAMAEGTVVITGGEEEYYDFIGEKELRPTINLRPGEDAENYERLCQTLLNRETIKRMSRESRAFVEKYHDADRIASEYLSIWEGKTDKAPIHVAIATDETYLKYATAMLLSLTDLHRNDTLEIHLLGKGIEEDDQTYLQSLLTSTRHHIHYYNIGDSRLKGMPQGKETYISPMTYSRLFLGEILPRELEKVIYLDCDVLVEGSLRKLWEMPLGDRLLAAVEDLNSADINIYGRLKLLPQEHVYFNAGVILLNLRMWRNGDYQSQALDAIRTHGTALEYGDQDVLNLIAKGRVAYLPLRYNLQDFLLRTQKPPLMREEALKDWDREVDHPVVIHFTWHSKPWDYRSFNPYGKRFWTYIDRTKWNGWRPSFSWKERLWRLAYRIGIILNRVNRYR